MDMKQLVIGMDFNIISLKFQMLSENQVSILLASLELGYVNIVFLLNSKSDVD